MSSLIKTEDPQIPPKDVSPTRGSSSHALFKVYKKGQGYYTRLGTAIGAGVLIAATLLFLYNNLKVWPVLQKDGRPMTPVIAVILAMVASLLCLLAWWLMNRPTNAEFLIATDSEMKKVNWATWKELIGSTRVVIFFVFATALFLFAIDVLFGYLFYFMTVLKTRPF